MFARVLTTVLLGSVSLCTAIFADGMPLHLKQQIHDNFIGSWEYTTTFDGKVEKTKAVVRWSHGKDAIIEEATNVDAGFTITQIGGWDPVSKSLVFHAFTSRGDRSMARYDKLMPQKWSGQGEGFWEGKNWKSPVTIEWMEDGFRYEDVTEGKPFIVVGKRLARKDAVAALNAFTGFMEGTWTRTDDGFVREHVYGWTSAGKFMRSNGNKDPQAWDGMIGVDESNGKVGWWGFMSDGVSGVVHLLESQSDQWIFEGVDYGSEGPFHRRIVVKKLSHDKLQGRVEDSVDGKTEVKFDETWQRK